MGFGFGITGQQGGSSTTIAPVSTVTAGPTGAIQAAGNVQANPVTAQNYFNTTTGLPVESFVGLFDTALHDFSAGIGQVATNIGAITNAGIQQAAAANQSAARSTSTDNTKLLIYAGVGVALLLSAFLLLRK